MEIVTPAGFETKPIDEQYYYFHEAFEKISKGKILVILQDGSFYDMIGSKQGHVLRGADYELISQKLQFDICKKHGFTSVGFNVSKKRPILDKLITIYDEVLEVNEFEFGPNGRKVRRVARVHSLGTLTDDSDVPSEDPQLRYFALLYLSRYKRKGAREGGDTAGAAFSVTSFQTGETSLYEFLTRPDDPRTIEDDIIGFLQSHHIDELFLYTGCDELLEGAIAPEFMHSMEQLTKVRREGSIPPEHTKLDYQRQQIQKHFPSLDLSTTSVSDYLGIDHSPELLIVYVTLLQFCYSRYRPILHKVGKPILCDTGRYLTLSNRLFEQLSILPQEGASSSLYSLLNLTSTAMGARLLRNRIVTPIIDPSELQRRYDLLSSLLPLWEQLDHKLHEIADLDRLLKKLDLFVLTTNGVVTLYWSLKMVIVVITLLETNNIAETGLTSIPLFQLKDELNAVVNFIDEKIDIEKIVTWNHRSETNFFRPGVYPELDLIDRAAKGGESIRETICRVLSSYLNKKGTVMVYIKETVTGFELEMTRNRYDTLMGKIDGSVRINDELVLTEFEIMTTNKSRKIVTVSTPELRSLSDSYLQEKHGIGDLLEQKYHHFLTSLDEFVESMRTASQFIAHVDLYKALAKAAKKYNYVRPELDINADSSYLVGKQLRHPLVERIVLENYVAHDLVLGVAPDGEPGYHSSSQIEEVPGGQLVVLFGTNKGGKSVLAKAVALIVVMAQIGSFVPATSLRLAVYHSLFARILTKDNQEKAVSSFEWEMYETKPMLERSNRRSLLVADELTHGTDPEDGVAFLAAALNHIAKTGANGLFTTHLRTLVEQEEVKGNSSIKTYHLECEVGIDRVAMKRRLLPGPELQRYGLETAAMVGIPSTVIKEAQRIRRRLIGEREEYLSHKTSRYNKRLYLDLCQRCQEQYATETHHLLEQKDQVDGFVGHVPIHSIGNLKGLCRSCHQELHAKE